jgi:pimeloyl-ACP methyl ester carboxylesterase
MQSGELNSFGPGLRYLLGVPKAISDRTPVVTCVHGIRRNVQEHFQAFAPLAEREGWLLVVPLFAADAFPDYQRLGRPGKGGRADLRLIELISHLCERFDLPEQPIHLFGHSGGGQFAHRFVMAHPWRVVRYVVSSPGWYTFPDESIEYPYGLAHAETQGLPLSPRDFLKVPGAVFVGTADFRSGRHLRRNSTVDLHQGPHRLERARRWAVAVNARARELGLPQPVQLRQLPDGAHNFSGLVRSNRLHEQAWRFLANSSDAAT